MLLGCGSEEVAECVRVSGSAENDAQVTVGGTVRDFHPRVAHVYWRCENQQLIVALRDASCDPSVAQDEVRLLVYRQDVESGLIFGGGRFVLGGDTFIHAEFLSEDGVRWGTCDGPGGQLILDEIGVEAGDRVAGTFDVPLAYCGGSVGDAPSARIEGSIDVLVPQSHEEQCGEGVGEPHPRDR